MPAVQRVSGESRPRRVAQVGVRTWTRAKASGVSLAGRLMSTRLRNQAQLLGDYIAQGDAVLDVGCESGHLCQYIAEMHGAVTTGIDVHDATTVPIDFKVFDGESIPFDDNAFDHVVLSFVLHHSVDPMALIKECRRVARRNVILFEDIPKTRFEKMSLAVHIWIFNVTWGLKAAGDYRAALRWLGDTAAQVIESPILKLGDPCDHVYRVPHVLLVYRLSKD